MEPAQIDSVLERALAFTKEALGDSANDNFLEIKPPPPPEHDADEDDDQPYRKFHQEH